MEDGAGAFQLRSARGDRIPRRRLVPKTVPAFPLPAGKRVLLHFQAAATEAEVWWDGERVGTHLGGWTPFRFDITDLVRKAAAGRPHELRVRLDEKLGHNTQGFLPIIAPHFGGLWQDVQLLVVPETYCDDLNLLAVGNLETAEIQLDIPLCGKLPAGEKPLGRSAAGCAARAIGRRCRCGRRFPRDRIQASPNWRIRAPGRPTSRICTRWSCPGRQSMATAFAPASAFARSRRSARSCGSTAGRCRSAAC